MEDNNVVMSDKTNNDLKLYIFKNEQMIIEKTNVAVNSIELSNEHKKEVIS